MAKFKRFKGLIFILIAAALFSTGGLFIKMVRWQPLSINSGRCIIGASVIGIYMLITKHKPIFNRFVLLGAFALTATNILFTYSNKLTNAANAIVLQYTAPIFIILFTWMFMKHKPDRVDIISTPFMIFGVICFFIDGLAHGSFLGNVLAFVSAATYAVIFMLKILPNSDALSSVFFGMVFGAVIGLPSLLGETSFNAESVCGVIMLGVFQLGIAYIFFTEGLKTTPPLAASFVGFAEPLLSPCWVAIFLNEKLGGFALAGAFIDLVTVCIYNVYKYKAAEKKKAPIEQ